MFLFGKRKRVCPEECLRELQKKKPINLEDKYEKEDEIIFFFVGVMALFVIYSLYSMIV